MVLMSELKGKYCIGHVKVEVHVVVDLLVTDLDSVLACSRVLVAY